MAGILVGDDDCPISDIVNLFLKPPMDVVIMDKWTHFANALQIPYSVVKKLQRDLLLDKIAYADIGNELLINWLSRSGDSATVGNFLSIVTQNFVWKEVEDFLRTNIHKNAKEFNDLDQWSKEHILSCQIHFFGKERNLNAVKSLLKDDAFLDALNEHMDQALLQKALKHDVLKLDKVKLPKQLPYYMTRSLDWKVKLNPLIFREPCPDIFVFEGIKRHHLSVLVQPNPTDVSGKQLSNLNVKFILLELEDDFTEITKQAKVPVHRIKYKNGMYYWTFTAGSLELIQAFLLDNESKEISEQALVEEHLSTFCTRPLAIVSSPGMGKSVLMGNLAHRLQAQFPERFVLFLEIKSLVEHLNTTLQDLNLQTIKNFIALHVSESSLGQTFIRMLLDDEHKQFEVFLDGFDESPTSHIETATELLLCLLESKNIRAFITSRPHLRRDLEDIIGVVSFDIIPFQLVDQIEFLCRFWQSKLDVESKEKLSSFASIVVKEISSDFIGVPLQCFLLAEIYTKEAQRYLNADIDDYQLTNPSKSLFDLYNSFIQMKFENVSKTDREFVRKFHWIEASKLLFPDNEFAWWIEKNLSHELSQHSTSLESIYTVGIMEERRMAEGPVFLHMTLAEFLVADMVIEYLKGSQLSDCRIMVLFILDSILEPCLDTKEIEIDGDLISWVVNTIESSFVWKTSPSSEQIARFTSALLPNLGIPKDILKGLGLNSIFGIWRRVQGGKNATLRALVRVLRNLQWQEIVDELEKSVSENSNNITFTHYTVCFFVDASLSKCKEQVFISSHVKSHFKTYRKTKKWLFSTSSFWQIIVLVRKDYKHLFETIITLLEDGEDAVLKYEHCQILLICAAMFGDVQLFQCCSNIVDSYGETMVSEISFTESEFKDVKYELTPLHYVLKRGNYKLSEHLINLYRNKLAQMLFLYENIFWHSSEDSPDVVATKTDIIFLLRSRNLVYDVESFRKDMLTSLVATELFITLSDVVGYVPEKKDGEFIVRALHLSIVNDCKMNICVDWLVSNNLVSFLTLNNSMLLDAAMELNFLPPGTLAKIYNLCPFDVFSLMEAIVLCKRGEEFVKEILDIFKNVNISDSKKMTLLHHAALYKKPNIIRHLLSVGASVNTKNDKGETPLVLACYYDDNLTNFKAIEDCVELLLHHGADVVHASKYLKLGRTGYTIYLAGDFFETFIFPFVLLCMPHTCQINLQAYFIQKIVNVTNHVCNVLMKCIVGGNDN